MERLTNEQLAEIRKRAEAATQGPWYWEKFNLDDDDYDTEMPILNSDKESIMDFGDGEQYYPTEGTPPNEADAEFIAHAREDVPKLLAEIERLKELAQEILEEYNASERGHIGMSGYYEKNKANHEKYIAELTRRINGVDDDGKSDI